MKQLFILIFITIALTSAGYSQSSIAQDENLFVQEKIGNNFNQVSIVEGDIQLLFHQDRIELISSAEGETSSFFVMLHNVSFDMPEGEGMVNREIVPITDSGMANVLKASTIEKSYFKSITYTDNKSGKTLSVNIEDNKLVFNGTGDLPLELHLWGNAGETISKTQTVQLERFGKIIKFSSDNGQVNKNENIISLNKDGEKEDANLNLSITIL